jgi:hypothetical protein
LPPRVFSQVIARYRLEVFLKLLEGNSEVRPGGSSIKLFEFVFHRSYSSVLKLSFEASKIFRRNLAPDRS